MMFYRLNHEIINLPNVANALDELDKLAERDSLPIMAILDNC